MQTVANVQAMVGRCGRQEARGRRGGACLPAFRAAAWLSGRLCGLCAGREQQRAAGGAGRRGQPGQAVGPSGGGGGRGARPAGRRAARPSPKRRRRRRRSGQGARAGVCGQGGQALAQRPAGPGSHHGRGLPARLGRRLHGAAPRWLAPVLGMCCSGLGTAEGRCGKGGGSRPVLWPTAGMAAARAARSLARCQWTPRSQQPRARAPRGLPLATPPMTGLPRPVPPCPAVPQVLVGTSKQKLWLYDTRAGRKPQAELLWGEGRVTALAPEPQGEALGVEGEGEEGGPAAQHPPSCLCCASPVCEPAFASPLRPRRVLVCRLACVGGQRARRGACGPPTPCTQRGRAPTATPPHSQGPPGLAAVLLNRASHLRLSSAPPPPRQVNAMDLRAAPPPARLLLGNALKGSAGSVREAGDGAGSVGGGGRKGLPSACGGASSGAPRPLTPPLPAPSLRPSPSRLCCRCGPCRCTPRSRWWPRRGWTATCGCTPPPSAARSAACTSSRQGPGRGRGEGRNGGRKEWRKGRGGVVAPPCLRSTLQEGYPVACPHSTGRLSSIGHQPHSSPCGSLLTVPLTLDPPNRCSRGWPGCRRPAPPPSQMTRRAARARTRRGARAGGRGGRAVRRRTRRTRRRRAARRSPSRARRWMRTRWGRAGQPRRVCRVRGAAGQPPAGSATVLVPGRQAGARMRGEHGGVRCRVAPAGAGGRGR
jgi:hypothetical protein